MRLAPLLTVTAAVVVVTMGAAAPAAEAAPSGDTGTSTAQSSDPADGTGTEKDTGTEKKATPKTDSDTDTAAGTGTDTTTDTTAGNTAEKTAARTVTQLRGDLDVHDPALLKGAPGQKWYVFSSGKPDKGGGTIDIRTSSDNGRTWVYDGTLWDAMPSWMTQSVPGANNMWAPAVHEHAGTYYLYYAVSTTGHNDSVIGVATNTTLDRSDPAYKWVDQGKVVRSVAASDFNAIDPEVVEDDAGTPWLTFGSYWSGIQMVQLEWPSGKRSADKERHHLADRKLTLNAIEAPSIVRHGGWYYLLTSWDRCCRGTDSTYRIVVGRSKAVTGPYVDRDGKALTDAGGTTLLSSDGDRVGPGGESVSGDVIAYHYYDGADDGSPTLALRQLAWTADGWPQLKAGDELKARRATTSS